MVMSDRLRGDRGGLVFRTIHVLTLGVRHARGRMAARPSTRLLGAFFVMLQSVFVGCASDGPQVAYLDGRDLDSMFELPKPFDKPPPPDFAYLRLFVNHSLPVDTLTFDLNVRVGETTNPIWTSQPFGSASQPGSDDSTSDSPAHGKVCVVRLPKGECKIHAQFIAKAGSNQKSVQGDRIIVLEGGKTQDWVVHCSLIGVLFRKVE